MNPMAKREKLLIGPYTFETKKACMQHVQQLISSTLGEGAEVRPCHEHFGFLRELFERHHEKEQKYGSGLAGYKVGRDTYGNLHFLVMRVDGTEVDISWRTAVSGTGRTPRQNLEAAMRQAIAPQIDEVRTKTDFSSACPLCGVPLNARASHVDHDEPRFTDLVRTFLDTYGMEAPETFDDAPGRNAAVFRPQDHAFAAAWASFHRSHAKLRAVHDDCNLKRGRTSRSSPP